MEKDCGIHPMRRIKDHLSINKFAKESNYQNLECHKKQTPCENGVCFMMTIKKSVIIRISK